MNGGKEFSETITWVTILGINLIILAFAYWLFDIALMLRKHGRRLIALNLATLLAIIGAWRMIAVIIYRDDISVMLAIPITAAITWTIIGVLGYVGHRYAVAVNNRLLISQANYELTERVTKEIVEPLLRGEPVSREQITELKAASIAYSAKVK